MTLVDGHGNFGSIEGDGAAAMRYTEARLEKFAEEVYLKDLDKTVDFVPNYDETEKEPEVLPVRVPNLLINGAEGIAVGMSTSIPPHILGEVVDAVDAYIDDPDISTEKLMELMPGPDFPTGGIIANKSDLPAIYEARSSPTWWTFPTSPTKRASASCWSCARTRTSRKSATFSIKRRSWRTPLA